MNDRERQGGEHLDEAAALGLAEGGLEGEQASAAAAHAGACARCGALVRALERESAALRQALVEDDEPLPARLREASWAAAAPAHRAGRRVAADGSAGWAWGWALAFGLIVAAAYTAWLDLLESSSDPVDQAIQGGSIVLRMLAGGAAWLGGLWDAVSSALIYGVGDGGSVMWTGALYLILLAALGTGAALLVRRYRGKAATAAILAGMGALLLVAPGGAQAADIRRGQEITVNAGETVQNDLIAMGNRVRVDGTVTGDLIAFTQNLEVNGHVDGDVIIFGDLVRLGGTIDGNVRCFCNTLALDGHVGRNVSVAASWIDLDPRATVGWGIVSATGRATLDGKVGRDWMGLGRNLGINGSIGGDVKVLARAVSIGSAAAIGGLLDVTSDAQPQIASGAKLGRPLSWRLPPQRAPVRRALVRVFVFRHIVGYAAALLFGLLLIEVFPGFFTAGMAAARRAGMAMGVGALVVISSTALLIAAVILLIAGAWTGMAAMALYLPAVYTAQIFVGAWTGEKLMRGASSIGQLALGLLIVRIAGVIPFLGFFVWLAVLIWGVGAVAMAIWSRTRAEAVVAVV